MITAIWDISPPWQWGDIKFAFCLSVCLSAWDASPPKLLNAFGWNFPHGWRSVPDLEIIRKLAEGCTSHLWHSSQIYGPEKWRTQKDRLLLGYLASHIIATSQLLHDVNKFLLEYVILFKRVKFLQYLICLHERIFNCCNILMSKFAIK